MSQSREIKKVRDLFHPNRCRQSLDITLIIASYAQVEILHIADENPIHYYLKKKGRD